MLYVIKLPWMQLGIAPRVAVAHQLPLAIPDGTIKVLVEGGSRARVSGFTRTDEYFAADAELSEPQILTEREAEVLTRALMAQFDQYVKLNKKIPPEI